MTGFDDEQYERDYPRETVSAKAQIRVDGEWRDCVISNISPSGAKLSVGLPVDRGAGVVVQLGKFGEYNATVAWCHGDEIGVKFDHDPEEMTHVLIGLAS